MVSLFVSRSGKRKWVATSRGLCQSWGILPGRNSSVFTGRISLAFARVGALEWAGGWSYSAICLAYLDHMSDKLGKKGSYCTKYLS